MNDNEILKLYRLRSESAISATAEKYGAYCHSIAYRILQIREDAEECVNDTYLCAWNSIPPHFPNRLSTYLGKLTRNLSLNRRKRQNAEKRGFGQVELALAELEECLPSSESVDDTLSEQMLTEILNEFLRKLPESERSIFIRRYWHLEPIRDISAHFAMSESKVTSLLFRLRKRLKIKLEKEGISI